jgi:hypothetical protein
VRRVVYTCLFGYSEAFLDLRLPDDGRTDFICFTDDPELRSQHWRIVQAPKSLLDPHRRSKSFKHRPHLLFPQHECSLYIDNRVRLLKPPAVFFDFLQSGDAAIWLFAHPFRKCVFDEAEAVKEAGYDDPSVVDQQMRQYRLLGYPANAGLNTTTLLARRHNDPKLATAMDDWHGQVLRFSKRDQLSFNVIKHFHQLETREFPGALTNNDLVVWPAPPDGPRLPRDFDDAEYLSLHPDVLAAGMNPRKHYLMYGLSEGRPYKAVPSSPPASP